MVTVINFAFQDGRFFAVCRKIAWAEKVNHNGGGPLLFSEVIPHVLVDNFEVYWGFSIHRRDKFLVTTGS